MKEMWKTGKKSGNMKGKKKTDRRKKKKMIGKEIGNKGAAAKERKEEENEGQKIGARTLKFLHPLGCWRVLVLLSSLPPSTLPPECSFLEEFTAFLPVDLVALPCGSQIPFSPFSYLNNSSHS